MDFNGIVVAGILGAALLNALALAGVLWMTRPVRYCPAEPDICEVQSAPRLRVVTGQPGPVELAA